MAFGIYIHVPFCKRKCPYCDFYSRIPKDGDMDRYTAALVGEIKEKGPSFPPVTSVYFGGGTPNLLGGENLRTILDTIYTVCKVNEGEITVECNPESLTEKDIQRMAAAGVNRISMGVQSAVAEERRALGRIHTNAQVAEAVDACRRWGIFNISLDFMLGIPFQTGESLKSTFTFLLERDVPHLSLYLLSIEEGTPFYKKHPPVADEDLAAQFYEETASFLKQAGYTHYEISNFAKPGFESRHNLTYWRCEEYYGFGAGAHSFYNKRRFFMPNDFAGYCAGSLSPIEDGEGGGFDEVVMLGLRLKEGVDLEALHKKFTMETENLCTKAKPLIQQGFMMMENHRLRLSERGFLLSNTLIANLF